MAFRDVILADSPYAYWRLNDLGATAADDSGNSRTGAYTGMTLGLAGAIPTDPANHAVSSPNPANDYVRSNFMLNTSQVTLECWIKVTGTPSADTIIAGFFNGYAATTYDKVLYLDTARKLRFYAFDVTASAAKYTPAGASAIPVNQWVHVVGVYDGTRLRAYVNGAEVGSILASSTYAGYTVNNVFLRGKDGGTPAAFAGTLAASLDEFAVYNTGLSAARIAAHYAAGIEEPPPPPPPPPPPEFRLAVGGADLPLDEIEAELTVRHGRQSPDDAPLASSLVCSLVGVDRAFSGAFRVGAELAFDHEGHQRFAGRITDATLDDDRLSLVAVSSLARKLKVKVGADDWPVEPWASRVGRIFGLGPDSLVVNLAPNGGFEANNDSTYWTGYFASGGAGAEGRQSGFSKYGAWAFRLDAGTVDLGGGLSGRGDATGAPVLAAGVDTGATYTISAWFAGAPCTVRFGVKWVSGGTTVYDTVDVVVGASWARAVHSFTRPAAGVYISIEIKVAGTATTWFYVDGVQLEKGALAHDYVDTSTGPASNDPAPTPEDEVVLRQVDPAFNPLVAARAAAETTIGALLGELTASVPAAVADTPDGRVLIQALGFRSTLPVHELDPDLVAFAPEWTQVDDVQNVIDFEWFAGTVHVEDAVSIEDFPDAAPLTLQSNLYRVEDATARAADELALRALPAWTLGGVELLAFDPDIGIGTPIGLSELQPAAPVADVVGLVEGWQDHVRAVRGELAWNMTLYLSSAERSGYTP